MAGPLIAIVDDDPAFVEMMELVLGGEGYQVVASNDTRQAYELLRSQRPDLLVLDLRIGRDMRSSHPGAGWVLLELLRVDPLLASLPVLVCSADVRALRQWADRFREKGCAILEKPFNLDDMLGLVHQVCPPVGL